MAKKAISYIVGIMGEAKPLGIVYAKSKFAAQTQAVTRFKLNQGQVDGLVIVPREDAAEFFEHVQQMSIARKVITKRSNVLSALSDN